MATIENLEKIWLTARYDKVAYLNGNFQYKVWWNARKAPRTGFKMVLQNLMKLNFTASEKDFLRWMFDWFSGKPLGNEMAVANRCTEYEVALMDMQSPLHRLAATMDYFLRVRTYDGMYPPIAHRLAHAVEPYANITVHYEPNVGELFGS